jgi:hypothetical protein
VRFDGIERGIRTATVEARARTRTFLNCILVVGFLIVW